MRRRLAMGICSLLVSVMDNGVLISEHFSYPDGPLPEHFWSEGCPATIRNGKLFIDADTVGPRSSSVWLDQELDGDLVIEFDVSLVSSSDDANNINLFFMYGPLSGTPLKESAGKRADGLYKRYHELKGYIFTNVTNGDAAGIRYRFRKNPDFNLVSQTQGLRKARELTVHIKVIKKGRHFQYWENEQKIFDEAISDIDEVYESGLFGFRTWHTALEIDNLIIKRI